MTAWLAQAARTRGLRWVEMVYRRTPKNRPALDFLESIAIRFGCNEGDQRRYRLPVEQAAAIVFSPPERMAADDFLEPSAPMAGPSIETAISRSAALTRLAVSLRAPAALVEAIDGSRSRVLAPRPVLSVDFVEPQSETEKAIAVLWREALGLEAVGIDDHFFDLGGSSLLLTQVHARLNALRNDDIPLVELLEHPTIGALADWLDRKKVGTR